jgi:PAS domain S-box-containing protein
MNAIGFILAPDYLQYLSGLAFFVLAAVSFSLRRIPTPLLSWTSLGWFGVLLGACQWLECAAFSMGRLPVIEAASSILFAGAITCLLLFSSMELLPRRVTKPWLRMILSLTPIAVLAVVMEVGGVREYELATFLFLAGTATFCARRMWRLARFSRVAKSALGLATFCMILMALAFLAGAPKEYSFLASRLNREVFSAVAGFPITCVYVVVPLLLSASLWQAYQYAVRGAIPGGREGQKSWFGFQVMMVMVSVACGGWVLTQQAGEQAHRKYVDDLMARAVAITAALDMKPTTTLTGTLEDLKLPEYAALHDLLTRIRRSSVDIRNIYLYGPRNGQSINFVASTQEGAVSDVLPGTIFADQLDDEDRAFFETGVPYVSKPYTDRWGKWVSALVGVLPDNARPGQLKMALGVDVASVDVEHQVAAARFSVILQAELISLILMGLFLLRQHWWDRTRHLELNQAVVMKLSRQGFVSLTTALKQVAQTLAETLDTEAVAIWLLSDDRNSLVCKELYSLSKGKHERGAVFPVTHCAQYLKALEAKHSLAIYDVRVDSRARDLAADYLNSRGVISLLSSPILSEGSIQGILWVEHSETIRVWTAEEVQLVLAMADMAALRLEEGQRRKIAALKHESEERYRRVFEHSPEAIMVLDDHDQLVELNRRAVEITGYPAEEFLGKAMLAWPCFGTESRTRVKELMESLRENKAVAPCELTLEGFNQPPRIGFLCAAPLLGPEGRVMGTLVIISDITERKQGEEKLKGMLNELERHNRLMSGRESRILELKQEVNGLLSALGRPPAYQSVLMQGLPGGASSAGQKKEDS